MKFTTRQLVLLAVFGALWGAVEISIGAILHTLHIPLTGVILAALGLAVAITGRLFVPRRGATLFIGLVAMLLKLFSIGGIVLGPMVGILAEALVAELVLSAFPRPTRLSFILACSLGVLWTLVHPFFTGLLFFGRNIVIVWLDLLDEGTRLLHLDSHAAVWIVLGLVVLRLGIGALAGWIAWQGGKTLQARLAATYLPAPVS